MCGGRHDQRTYMHKKYHNEIQYYMQLTYANIISLKLGGDRYLDLFLHLLVHSFGTTASFCANTMLPLSLYYYLRSGTLFKQRITLATCDRKELELGLNVDIFSFSKIEFNYKCAFLPIMN